MRWDEGAGKVQGSAQHGMAAQQRWGPVYVSKVSKTEIKKRSNALCGMWYVQDQETPDGAATGRGMWGASRGAGQGCGEA